MSEKLNLYRRDLYTVTRVSTSSGGTKTTTTWPKDFLARRMTYNGTVTPNWKQFHKANGYLPIQAYSSHHREASLLQLGTSWIWATSTCGGSRQDISSSFRVTDNLDNSAVVNPVWTDSSFLALRAQAIATANGKVRDTKASMGETLAELNKTKDMVADLAVRIAKAARQVRKGKWKAAATTLGLLDAPKGLQRASGMQKNWLAYRYGWTPLYLTAYGAMELAYDHYRGYAPILMATGRSPGGTSTGTADVNGQVPTSTSTSYDASWTGSPTAYDGSPQSLESVPFTLRTKRVRSFYKSVEIGYLYRVTNPTLSVMTQLGLDNPALIAWELVPLSFVYDWFLNVGDIIEQIGAFNGREFITGWDTRRQVVIQDANSEVVSWSSSACYTPAATRQGHPVPAKYRRTDRFVNRIVLTSPPTFGIHLNNGLNMTRFTDAVSLIGQRLR